MVACPCHLCLCVPPSQWPQRGPLCDALSLSPTSLCATVLAAAEGTSVWLSVPVTRLAACHHPCGLRGDFSVASCPHHPSLCVSVGWWLWGGTPQCGRLSLSPASVCVSGPVATEGTSAWLLVAVTCLPVYMTRGNLDMAACPCHPPLCVSQSWWPQRGPQCGCLSLSPASLHVSKPVAVEGTSVQLTVPITRLPMCHHSGDLSVATCGRHPPPCVSVGWWPRRGPQCGHLWLSPVFMCVSQCQWLWRGPQCGCLSLSPLLLRVTILVAAEGTSAWSPVPVTRPCACQWAGGFGGDLSVAACPHQPSLCVSQSWWLRRGLQCGCLSLSPVLLCVTTVVAPEGTLAWPPVPVTRLCVCLWVGGRGGGLIVATCPCHPSSCVSPSWWPRRGPRTAARPRQPPARVPVPPAQAAVSPQTVTTSCCRASRGPWG